MLDLILLAIGFVLLIKGADWLVEGASSIAKKFRISDLVIGLTIVAFGTSAPELIVNVFASLQGNTGIAVGNIIGSNISNILLILGVCAVIYPLAVTKSTIQNEIPLSFLAGLVLFFMANDALLGATGFSGLSMGDGLVLLIFFAIFMYYTFGISKREGSHEGVPDKEFSLPKSVLVLLVGLAILNLGGKLVVDSAVSMASSFGVSQTLIGLTIVAIGTSLPELAASAVAAFQKKADIAIGNVVGSNIFNIFFVLGISSTINPLPFTEATNLDIGVVLLATILILAFLRFGKKNFLEKWNGVAFILLYVVYLIFIILRG